MFNAAPADELDAASMVDFLKDNLKVSKIGIIHDANDYGVHVRQNHLRRSSKKERRASASSAWKSTNSADRDMSAQLINLKNAGSQGVVIWGVGFAPAVIVRELEPTGAQRRD